MNNERTGIPPSSPIASISQSKKSKSPKRTLVTRLLASVTSAMEESSTDYTTDEPTADLFSPKYSGGTPETSPIPEPQQSPIRKKKKTDPVYLAAKSMKKKLWSSCVTDFDAFMFMKKAPPVPDTYFARQPPVLPRNGTGHSHTLVLDLDETLVHCTIERSPKPDLVFPVTFNGDEYRVYMRKRPHFRRFLETVSKMFEVVVFTASQECYADTLLDMLDPDRKLIQHRLFRGNCVQVEGNFVKDLRVLGRDLKTTIIIDNSPAAFTNQVTNGIPIRSWFDDDEDDELLTVIPVLSALRECEDVRPLIQRFFQLGKLLDTIGKR